MYAKAVHVPTQLHNELVAQPAADAKKATDAVHLQEEAIAELQKSGTPSAARLTEMRNQLAERKAEETTALRAAKQRSEQFNVMRNDVFHTNDATDAAKARLEAKKVSAEKIREFEKSAAVASTPEQIALLEREFHP